jgi:hypothetical protein
VVVLATLLATADPRFPVVLGLGAPSQVRRLEAGPVVAGMQNLLPLGLRAMDETADHLGHSGHPTEPEHLAIAEAEGDLPVAGRWIAISLEFQAVAITGRPRQDAGEEPELVERGDRVG